MFKEKTLRDIMTQTVITGKTDMPLTEIVKLLLRWHISGIPIIDDDGRIMGIVTEHDVVQCMLSGTCSDTLAGDAMTKNVKSYPVETPVAEIIHLFGANQIRRVPVVKDDKLVGIISRRDIIREMNHIYDK